MQKSGHFRALNHPVPFSGTDVGDRGMLHCEFRHFSRNSVGETQLMDHCIYPLGIRSISITNQYVRSAT